jgi:HSP20 family protein
MAVTRLESWAPEWPARWRRWMPTHLEPDHWMRVEERHEDETLVIRAEVPGVDPDRDVEISVADGVLHLAARRQEHEEETDKGGQVRSEFRYGELRRDLPLPAGVDAGGIEASYRDGILEVRVPWPATAPERQVTRVPVRRS